MKLDRKKKSRQLNIGIICVAFMVLIGSLICANDFSHVDDVSHNELTEADILKISDLQDSASTRDHIDGDVLVIEKGGGLKLFTGEIDLTKGDAVRVSFTAVNNSEKNAIFNVDLYGENFDDPYDEFAVNIPPGEITVSKEIAFYRNEHPDKCNIRFFTADKKNLEIRDVKVDYMAALKDGNETVQKAVLYAKILAAVSAAFIILYLIYGIITNAIKRKEITTKANVIKNIAVYLAAIIFVTIILSVLYRNADLSKPLVYSGGDEMGVYAFAKSIDQNGMSLVTPNMGGSSGADMFDYPYSDKLSFLFVKIIGLFTDNPYVIINLFYYTNYYLIALVSTAISRKLGLSRINSFVVGALFAFSPYIQLRYGHIWLTPYYMLPVACLISIHIIQGRIPEEENRDMRNKLFWCGIILAFLCAFTGMYYAYFACALFATSMVIRIINVRGKQIRKELYPIAYIASTIIGVIVNVLPNLFYWSLFGTNPCNELTGRNRGDAETYGLKLVQMILPRPGHRIHFFAWINDRYNANYPLVTENMSAALGIIAAIGLLISLLMLFSEKSKYKEISYLNFSVFIIATIGGLGSIISVAVHIPMRCYNRMSLIIMFLSLLLIGMLLDRLKERIHPAMAIAISICILAIGLFDQTANYVPYDDTEFNNAKNLFQCIENETNTGDMIYMLPYTNWPTIPTVGAYGQMIGYIETNSLHWSYGAMQGREEAKWQEYVANCDIPEMIEKLKYAGYNGIYLDKSLYEQLRGADKTEEAIVIITQETGETPLVSIDSDKYYWSIE